MSLISPWHNTVVLTFNLLADANTPPANLPNSFTAASGTTEAIESTIWYLDPATNELTLQWTNSDGSKYMLYLDVGDFTHELRSPLRIVAAPTTVAALDTLLPFLFATGDLNAFLTIESAVTVVRLSLIHSSLDLMFGLQTLTFEPSASIEE